MCDKTDKLREEVERHLVEDYHLSDIEVENAFDISRFDYIDDTIASKFSSKELAKKLADNLKYLKK